MIKEAISCIFNNSNLSKTQIQEVFEEILSGLCDDILAACFITALELKGLDYNETLGAILSTNESINLKDKFNLDFLSKLPSIQNQHPLNCNNFLDISILQDIICAANGLFCYKYSFLDKINNSFEILKLMGINLDNVIKTSDFPLEEAGLIYFYLNDDIKFKKYTNKLRRNIPFDNVLNRVIEYLNPLRAKNIFYYTNSQEESEQSAKLFLDLNMENVIVVSNDTTPYVGLENDTYIAEGWKNKIFTYVVNMELLGFKKAKNDELKCENNEQNAKILYDILDNKIKDSRYDCAIVNSALSLYISKKSSSVMDGINLAKKTIDEGLAKEKFEQIKKFYN